MKERSPAPNPPVRDGAAVEAVARVEGLVEFTRTARLRSLTEVLEAVARAAPGACGCRQRGGQCVPAGVGRLRDGDRARIRRGSPGTAGNHQSRDSVRPAVLSDRAAGSQRLRADRGIVRLPDGAPVQSLTNPAPLPTIAFRARAEARNQRIGLARPAPRWRSHCRDSDRQVDRQPDDRDATNALVCAGRR
jgi:hypothetical protein